MLDWTGLDWMDTPQTVTTTRAPAVLKIALEYLILELIEKIVTMAFWNKQKHLVGGERPYGTRNQTEVELGGSAPWTRFFYLKLSLSCHSLCWSIRNVTDN